jgi:hypothetical protein
MRTGQFYLNNHGSRWIILENGKKPKIKVLTPEGFKMLTPLYYSSFGNWATVAIQYKGVKYELFPEDSDGGPFVNLSTHLLKFCKETVLRILKKRKIEPDFCSPNLVSEIAYLHGVPLTSEEVVQISNSYK